MLAAYHHRHQRHSDNSDRCGFRVWDPRVIAGPPVAIEIYRHLSWAAACAVRVWVSPEQRITFDARAEIVAAARQFDGYPEVGLRGAWIECPARYAPALAAVLLRLLR